MRILIMPFFSERHDRQGLKQRFGLAEAIPTVLVTAGSAGMGAFEATAQGVLECGPVQVFAMAGRNEGLRRHLERIEAPSGSTLHAFGFVEAMAKRMVISDLAVSKSGGLTTAECLAMGLPMIVPDPIPGQQERSADDVIEAGAGVKAHGLESLRFKLRGLIADPGLLQRVREAARRSGRAHAAEEIVRGMLPGTG